ncbi:hypothetical protein FALBO_3433 [Fusarium albosuccineum]|uniref:Uncharacterized protein n=1 Tax=Fusarium albosuccineum TaxID=1237068 RepID=A0A8H4PBN7_9HYPO|nr:hypothetical protein FALBO_3433 [Fusarium albosuccineum]
MDEPDLFLGEVDTFEEDYIDADAIEESNDDGIESFAGTEFVDGLFANGSDLDEDGGRPVRAEREFKIDHSSGSFKMKPENFMSRTEEPSFDATQALEMFQRRYTMDYGRKASGSKPADPEDKYFPIFHLDMIGIVGRPLRPITCRSGFFDNVTFTLRYWHSSYVGKHVTTNLPFDIRNRTFRIATAASRELWFIVMHPLRSQMDDLSGSQGQRRQRQKASRRSSALERHHAKALAEYIISIFTDGELLGEGVEPSWGLNDRRSSSISYDKWTTFQTLFMENWTTFSRDHAYDRFWVDNEPAFHTYDCGANIEIEVNEELKALPMETRLRPENEDEDEDPDSDSATDSDTDSSSESSSAADPGGNRGRNRRTNEDETEVSAGRRAPDGSLADVDAMFNDSNQEHLYSGGLEHLRTELEKKYKIDNIDQISYALAADINCIERTPNWSSDGNNDGGQRSRSTGGAVSLLADRRKLVEHFGGLRGFTFYPLAFHPRYGNFSSPRPPRFLDDVCLVMRDNMSYRNNGAEDVLSFGYFHAYSNIKRTIRSRPEDLLPARGIATGALTLPPSEASQRAHIRARQQRLLRTLSGEQTPEQPDLSMPFAREQHRIKMAMTQKQVAFRMEQVVTIKTNKLESHRRHFFSVLQPIFQLIRFFLKEKRSYTAVLRGFKPSIFPNVLCSFARLFELALAEMHKRFQARADKGLDLALAEAVAVLDRLGNYCFTGDSRVLMNTVLRPLFTADSLKLGAWPYVSADMLDFRGMSGKMDVVRWPRTKDEERKPILLHLASLEYHYGRVVAANCHSRVWFSQLGAEAISHIGSANKFMKKIFRGFWVPQMVSFMAHQLRVQLNQGARSGRDPTEHLRRSQRFSAILEDWELSEEPFSSEQLETLFPDGSTRDSPLPLPAPPTSNKARCDLAEEIYNACLEGDEIAWQAFASKNATWPSILREAIRNTSKVDVTAREWIDGITKQMAEAGIDWIPGCHCKRLTSRRVVLLDRIQRYTRPQVMLLTGPPGSLKRAAKEAELRLTAEEHAPKRNRKRRINLGSEIPFKKVPKVVQEGFTKLEGYYGKTDPSAVRHLTVAYNCLVDCLGDPLCDLMLMLALTFAACTVTPQIGEGETEFRPAMTKKKKNSDMLAAAMVTRMLWFMQSDKFPWEENDEGVLPVGKMTQKLADVCGSPENRGFNNRGLLKLGWIEASGNRRTPRTTESKLRSIEELYEDRKRLISAMKSAEDFISLVFRSDDEAWVARCSSIIQDRR